jgi:hypothetical protein
MLGRCEEQGVRVLAKEKPSAAYSGRDGQRGGLARLTRAQACARFEVGHSELRQRISPPCACVHVSARRPLRVFRHSQEVLDEAPQKDGGAAKLAGGEILRRQVNR